ncbi:MAG: hypothetical protein A3G33_11315 [Omnitrophica bacterium RIFCSPLOWO2_12_FULL_44_17]|uniref:Uncharacterized protein n=1 Tax=Candidatus Danuiimicrobium aquiferis TaxID=1801832 RepID=A0A1G1KRP2_9BACT|nr:MAG: hypothetical protein A3B72_09150 [Omnitrophica bacterium RIFCSPHIGHO2_02_FULL_45_28]OGW88340.1 MAG: hypothetical protein A3E74_10530 [Omnitrophica bacterium RIFCSPHIGHO2_12_FULL_44_12]OGW95583.1 MAG: hypothetical protein A3G33_11315 [Omnitrophica bacterium RIFCSPLOWO2_12_FULL_44_17]OGX03702.1 MAG: hypothetical protein A3J12_01175 [Omnitrophica bacterium RIFCSPLOWO2_02_FULL_44_11]
MSLAPCGAVPCTEGTRTRYGFSSKIFYTFFIIRIFPALEEQKIFTFPLSKTKHSFGLYYHGNIFAASCILIRYSVRF